MYVIGKIKYYVLSFLSSFHRYNQSNIEIREEISYQYQI